MIEWAARDYLFRIPELTLGPFDIGPLPLRWYGLVYALGFLLAYYILERHLEWEKRKLDRYFLYLLIGGVLGGRLFYTLVYNPGFYFANPSQILAVWHGGMSIHGGILGAILATLLFTRKEFYKLGDLLVAPLALVLVFGRLANWANAELWGTLTDVPWCVEFPTAEGCRHPSQLYEALYSLALFVLLAQEYRKLREGTLFWLFIGLYGLFRFIVTFSRDLDPTDPGFLFSIGQWLSLVMVVAALVWFSRKGFKKPFSS